MNIDLLITLCQAHNTMGYVVQEKLFKIVRGDDLKNMDLDASSRSRIDDFLTDCVNAKVAGAQDLKDKVATIPTEKLVSEK